MGVTFVTFFACSSPVQPLFYGCCICCIFAAFSPLQPLFYRRSFRSIFGRSRGRQTSYSPNTYSSRNLPVSVLPPWSDHGKGRFWAPLAFFASRVGRMIAATIKSPWRASCDLVCQNLALSQGQPLWGRFSHFALTSMQRLKPRRGPGSWIAPPPRALPPNTTAQPLNTTPALAGI